VCEVLYRYSITSQREEVRGSGIIKVCGRVRKKVGIAASYVIDKGGMAR
jgi:hypothetical protein